MELVHEVGYPVELHVAGLAEAIEDDLLHGPGAIHQRDQLVVALVQPEVH